MTLEIYPKITDSEFALFQAEAESFAEELACQGVIIGKHDSSTRFFDLSARGDSILFVNNSGPSSSDSHHVYGWKRCNRATALERWMGLIRRTQEELERT